MKRINFLIHGFFSLFILLTALPAKNFARSVEPVDLKVVITDLETSQKIYQLKYDISEGIKKPKALWLNLRRLASPEGQPIILSHAVVLNNHAMMTLGHWLFDQGYDVWMPNMAGHGNGDEQSRTEPYENGDYHFDQIVTRDWPRIHQFVREQTGKNPVIIGYSMGGMTWQQYLSGVFQENDSIRQNTEHAKERAAQTTAFIELTVPEDLTVISSTVKKLLHPLLPILKRIHCTIPFTTSESSACKPCGYFERMRSFTLSYISPVLPWFLPAGIINTSRCEDDEFNQLVQKQISSPHSDYVSDLISWFYTDYSSADHNINYGEIKEIYTPTFKIVASDDELAPAEYTLSRSSLYPKESQVTSYTAQGYAHIDISFREGVHEIGPLIHQFIQKHSDKTD